MRIIQLSDSHISLACPQRIADLETCIQHINAVHPQPDVVVHTGDVAHDGLAEEYDIARGLLDQLSAPYCVLPGNRDKRQQLIEAFADGNRIRNGMEFVQYSIEDYESRLICVDTISENSNKGRLCAERLAHIETMLAADTVRPTILFLHHPPFEVAEIPDPFQYEDWAAVKAFESLVGKNKQIRAVFCGHVHRDVEASIGTLPVSTISCVAADLRKGKSMSVGGNRPIFKIISIPKVGAVESRSPHEDVG